MLTESTSGKSVELNRSHKTDNGFILILFCLVMQPESPKREIPYWTPAFTAYPCMQIFYINKM